MSGEVRAAGGRDDGRANERTLDEWLSPEFAAAIPATDRTRLREIASARGAHMGAWAAGIGVGATLGMLGALITLRMGSPAPVWALGPAGVALVLGCSWGFAHARSRLPDADRVIVNRGPSSPRRALVFAGFILALFIAVFAFATEPGVWQDPAALQSLAIVLVFLIGLLVAALVVPATILGRARASLRRRAASDPRFRARLERDLAEWRDRAAGRTAPGDDLPYGPL